jgi:hypothetical protein
MGVLFASSLLLEGVMHHAVFTMNRLERLSYVRSVHLSDASSLFTMTIPEDKRPPTAWLLEFVHNNSIITRGVSVLLKDSADLAEKGDRRLGQSY